MTTKEKQETAQKRKEWINKQIQSGKSYADIGRELGISRQRVFQLVNGYRGIFDKVRK